MTPIRIDPKVRELARELNLDWRGDCAQSLREFAIKKVRQWNELLPVRSADTLLEMAASMLSLKLLYIGSDDDLRQFGASYRTSWPQLGSQLKAEFVNSDTMGFLLAHPSPEPGAPRYYAFIDRRGDRAVRAYFTAWHEVAHLLLQPPQLAFTGFRRVSAGSGSKDPIEALVDQIAGELAFFGPLAETEVARELEGHSRLTLDGIQRIRDAVAPEASFSATAHALVRLVDQPLAFLVADERLKPTEARALAGAQLQLIDTPAPAPKLRTASVFSNDAARAAGFKIFQNMRVPDGSVISDVYHERTSGTAIRIEEQGDWESSGKHLPQLRVRVEARKFGPVAYALAGL